MDVFRAPDATTAAEKFKEFSNIGQPVSGLGDQARASSDWSLLYILKGSAIVSITLLSTKLGAAAKQPDVPGAARSLATKLLSQI